MKREQFDIIKCRTRGL